MTEEKSIREMSKPHHNTFWIIMFLVLVFTGFMCGELAIRFLGKYDSDGNFRLSIRDKNLELKPFHLPINSSRAELEKYHAGGSYLIYDPVLGWVQRAMGASASGLNFANEEGVRRGSIVENTKSGKPGLQIVLLGDSYTHGDEVPFHQTWGYYLEKKLAGQRIQADVINLGVPGYGMDQALLRWKTFGVKYSPDYVIFGFQPENVNRNLNIFRKLYYQRSGMPFSKPRFILSDSRLKLVNFPTVPPDKIVQVLLKFDGWEHRKNEFFYRPEDYEDHLWLKSKLLAAGLAFFDYLRTEARLSDRYAVDQKPSRLALTILDDLGSDVKRRGGTFLVAILIPKWDFYYDGRSRLFPYQDLLETVVHRYDTVKTYPRLFLHAQEGHADELFKKLHYSAKGNEIVAEAIAEALAARELRKANPPS